MPSDPKLWTILDRVRADLAAIVAGANYNYTPHLVKVVRVWTEADLDESQGGDINTGGEPATIYLVFRGSRTIERQSTGDATTGPRDTATVEVGILAARRFVASSESDAPTEALVVERMLADIVRKLTFEDPGLGLVVDADDVLASDDTQLEDMPAGWACAGVKLQVAYQYFSSAP